MLLLVTALSHAQVNSAWVHHYKGSGSGTTTNETIQSMCVNNEGKIFATGHSRKNNDYSYFTFACDNTGRRLWETQDSTKPWLGQKVLADAQGNVYVIACKYPSPPMSVFYITQYDASGNVQWSVSRPGEGFSSDGAGSATLDLQGNLIIAYRKNNNAAILKYSKNGILQWESLYDSGQTGIWAVYDVQADNAGNVYVTGNTVRGPSNVDAFTVKYDRNGNKQWDAIHNGTSVVGASNDRGHVVRIDHQGNVYSAGVSHCEQTGWENYRLTKYSQHGALIWEYVVDGNNSWDEIKDMELDEMGNVYVTGYMSFNSTDMNFTRMVVTMKLDSDGNVLWRKEYDHRPFNQGQPHYYEMKLALDNNSNAYVAAYVYQHGPNSTYLSGIATVSYNKDGEKQWEAFHTGNTNSARPAEIAVTESGSVYVAGTDASDTAGFDGVIIKYDEELALSVTDHITPGLSMYPNPSAGSITVQIDSGNSAFLEVLDLYGRRVHCTRSAKGEYNVNMNLNHLPRGMYMLRATTGAASVTKQLLLIND